MKLSSVWIVIIGMTIVTYIPRLVPLVTISNKKIPRRLELFLRYVPYAALGALIMPGAITSVGDAYIAAFCGLIFAGLFAYFKGHILITVIGAILVTFLVQLI